MILARRKLNFDSGLMTNDECWGLRRGAAAAALVAARQSLKSGE